VGRLNLAILECYCRCCSYAARASDENNNNNV
jgi:hypothetical protein